MHIVYLGIMSRPEDIGKIGESSVAGNKMQYNLLKYLSALDGVTVDVVSFHPYQAPHRSKKLFVKRTKENLYGNVDLWQVGYINIPILKQLLLPWQTYRLARRLVKSRDDIVMAFDMYPTQGIPLTKLSRKVNGKTVCLLADLTIGGVTKQRGVMKWLRKAYEKSTLSNLAKCNHYIVLNENAAKAFVPHSKYVVVDGGVEPSEYPATEGVWDGKEKNIIYTGALVDYSGIMNLIDAMDRLEDKSIVLDIYGNGALKSKIEAIAAVNPRIRYHGSVTNTEAMQAQRAAWLLANPRPTESHIAKVTFPSKIFEYLMSGRPVMTTRLNGFSKDYDELLFWVDGETADDLATCIDRINRIEDAPLTERAKAAREYLLKHKTWKVNAEKIHAFLVNTVGENYESNDT